MEFGSNILHQIMVECLNTATLSYTLFTAVYLHLDSSTVSNSKITMFQVSSMRNLLVKLLSLSFVPLASVSTTQNRPKRFQMESLNWEHAYTAVYVPLKFSYFQIGRSFLWPSNCTSDHLHHCACIGISTACAELQLGAIWKKIAWKRVKEPLT